MHLFRFEFFMDHIEGSNNVFADILTRWSEGYRNTRTQKTEMIAAVYSDIVPAANVLELVKMEDIIGKHKKYVVPDGLEKDDEGI